MSSASASSSSSFSMRDLALGSALGLGVSLASVFSVIKLLRMQRDGEQGMASPVSPAVGSMVAVLNFSRSNHKLAHSLEKAHVRSEVNFFLRSTR